MVDWNLRCQNLNGLSLLGYSAFNMVRLCGVVALIYFFGGIIYVVDKALVSSSSFQRTYFFMCSLSNNRSDLFSNLNFVSSLSESPATTPCNCCPLVLMAGQWVEQGYKPLVGLAKCYHHLVAAEAEMSENHRLFFWFKP